MCYWLLWGVIFLRWSLANEAKNEQNLAESVWWRHNLFQWRHINHFTDILFSFDQGIKIKLNVSFLFISTSFLLLPMVFFFFLKLGRNHHDAKKGFWKCCWYFKWNLTFDANYRFLLSICFALRTTTNKFNFHSSCHENCNSIKLSMIPQFLRRKQATYIFTKKVFLQWKKLFIFTF